MFFFLSYLFKDVIIRVFSEIKWPLSKSLMLSLKSGVTSKFFGLIAGYRTFGDLF